MTDQSLTSEPPRRSNLGIKVALIGAGAAAGIVGATALGANAQTSTSSTATDTAATRSTASTAANPPAGHGAAPVRSDEKAVAATTAAKLKAAALKAVPGGTVYRIETDAGDAAYEAHMTKADGTEVTVKFDKNLAITKTESGMGAGDPAPAGGHGPGQRPNGTSPGGN
ncbi:MAG: hypothetical protein QOG01_4410 [Pseudonocardiales bacterium]|jgi:uncharacterized membrane protein YkoI|nr:hypothetical protein [Pseudonocardiales bacterium]